MKKQKQKTRRITFRIPAELADKVDRQRLRERRSLNTQLVILVELGLR